MHGLPTASWAATAMKTSRFNVAGLSNRGLAALAGNSMHVASVARLSMMCCVCVSAYLCFVVFLFHITFRLRVFVLHSIFCLVG